jgi:hypothetical protein
MTQIVYVPALDVRSFSHSKSTNMALPAPARTNITIEQSKKLAAYNAVDHHVKPEHRVSIVSLPTLGMVV